MYKQSALVLLISLSVPHSSRHTLCAVPPVGRADDLEFFESKVRPVLVEHCHRCHGPERQKAALRLDSRAALIKGGETGPAVIPGEPDKSLLMKGIRYEDAEFRMPPKGRLPDEAVANLKTWIERGAVWPDDRGTQTVSGTISKDFNLKERARHWSLQPLRDPPVPQVAKYSSRHTPSAVISAVDAFIMHKLEAAGLTPNPPADRRTLLRRVTYDLIGLPPTAEEIDAFLADQTPEAFPHVVERLLNSPHYGERWGRHWLDLVRFAETRGHEFDFDIPEAYRYRDYVIRAFNADVPYNQFVLEHLAGDLLPEPRVDAANGVNESLLGTGFFFLGEGKHSPVDVRGDQADRRDNQIDVLTKTFLGLTVACARCHDHKFDAISTQDYYALAGILESSRYHRAFIDAPPQHANELAQLRELREQYNAMAIPAAAEALREQVSRLVRTLPKQPVAEPTGGVFTSPADWFVQGDAFETNAPWFHPAADDRIIPHTLFHSGTLSDRLEGTLQSPTFTIASKKVHLLMAGRNAKVNLIINGFQLIRSPIYGGLAVTVNHGDALRWVSIDVGMWQGQRAYIEVLDDGVGFAALQQVVFSDNVPPLPTLASSTDEKNLREIIDEFAAGKLPREHGRLLAWLLETSRVHAQIATRPELGKLTTEYRQAEAKLSVPRRAPGFFDGTAVDEHVFIRGNHKKPGDIVARRFLEVFGGKDDHPRGSGRLDLARRMTDPRQTPIVPRVLVNRLWKHHFGEGIVRSPDDFGVLGQTPTHPELLDYLATQFVKQGWSIKQMHRLLLLSNTYQMASSPNAKGDEVDPSNKLLARMPVRRLEAESIRDAMLAVSGRLNRTQFGPSVPPHLTPFMAGRGRPAQSGPLDAAGRRSIYINIRRNFLTPMFLAFDYPTPFSTIGRRSVSNVPAQALTMMNNPLVVQQAEHWAKKVLASAASRDERIERMYESAFARPPSDAELRAALDFLTSDNEAAWADFAHVLFNLKEFIYVQ